LLERGILLSDEELQSLFDMLKFKDNQSENLSKLEIYANAHLFQLLPENQTPLLKKIALGCGAGITEQDLLHFSNFAEKVL